MKKLLISLLLVVALVFALASCDALESFLQENGISLTEKHNYSESWESDETHHWHACTDEECDAISDKAEYTGGTATDTEKAVCEVCGQAYGEPNVHVHSYNAVVTEPTCQAGGYTTYTCSCGDSYVADETGSTGHSYSSEVTAPTCTAAGYTTYTCSCGDSYTADEVDALNHNMVAASDDNHHWTECDREGCDEATEKVAHIAVSISASYNNSSAMEHDVVSVSDFTITAICECSKSYNVTEGVTLSNNTLVLGANTVTVTYGAASTGVSIEAAKFNKVVNGTVVDDTYVYSGSGYKDKNYADAEELSTNGDGSFRVLLRYNFSDIIANKFYQDYKAEAKVQFTFTMTTGSVDDTTKLTFKAYPVNETLSNVDFGILCWDNYDTTYGLGWGKADGFVNKEAGNPNVSIADGKITITLTLREIENYIDENGNALFVFAIWKSGTKVGSMENPTESNRPTVSVILNDEHQHAYTESVVDAKYLASANCEETEKYFKSCSCGKAGTVTFDHGEVIAHVYGEWTETQAPTCTEDGSKERICNLCNTKKEIETVAKLDHEYNEVVTKPTCTEAGFTTYTCIRGDHTYTANEVSAKGHTSNNVWDNNDSYHWNNCVDCGIQMNSDTHKGGEATETEQAICDTCKQPYGGLASHVHNHSAAVTAPTCTEAGYTTYTCDCGDVYTADEVAATGHTFGAWEVAYPATCEGSEILVHYCDCGVSGTSIGAAPFGHDMQTKFDEHSHWTECAHNCGKSTEAEAHLGGEATETEQATCVVCGQKYGELKPAEKKEYSIYGTIKDDTYIYSSSKTSDLSGKTEMGTYSDQFRVYFRFNFSDILNSADYAEAKADAKVQFSFVVSSGESNITDTTKYTFRVFGVDDATKNADFSELTWTNQATGGKYVGLGWGNATNLVSGETVGDKVSYANGVITLTINFSDIENMIDPTTGDALFVFAIPGTKSIKIASMENTTYAAPAVKFVYEK